MIFSRKSIGAVFVFFCTFMCSASSFAGNFATCILGDMPGVQNDIAATAVSNLCRSKFPAEMEGVKQGSGRGWFSYDSGAECAAKVAAKTQSLLAGRIIFLVCNRLYDKPYLTDEEVFGKP